MIVLAIRLLQALQTIILIRVVLTWIMPGRLPAPLNLIAAPIDKLLKHFRVLIPAGPAYIDLGPMLCLILLHVLQIFLMGMF